MHTTKAVQPKASGLHPFPAYSLLQISQAFGQILTSRHGDFTPRGGPVTPAGCGWGQGALYPW
jgi:hypothetical protein